MHVNGSKFQIKNYKPGSGLIEGEFRFYGLMIAVQVFGVMSSRLRFSILVTKLKRRTSH